MQNLRILLGVAVLALAAQNAKAGDCCPDCGSKACSVKWVEKTVKKKVYRVECKNICIPAFRFPWQMCFDPKCGKVRTIKVLKTVEIKCKKCGCEWQVQKLDNRCGAGAAGNCGCADCSKRATRKVAKGKKRPTTSVFPPSLSFNLFNGTKAKPKPKKKTSSARRSKPQPSYSPKPSYRP